MTDFPRRPIPTKDRPAREQAIIYLVNRLRKAFKAYRAAATLGEQRGAAEDFERALNQLDLIGIPIEKDDDKR